MKGQFFWFLSWILQIIFRMLLADIAQLFFSYFVGISSLISLKVSPDCEESILGSDDQYEAKKLDEQDGNPKCSQDISDELHTTSEVAIQGNVSIGYNNSQELEQLVSSDELDSISKEAKGMETTTQTLNNTDAVAG